MKIDWDAFTSEVTGLIKKTGDTGDSGDTSRKPLKCADKSVTARLHHPSPVVLTGDTAPSLTGDAFCESKQSVSEPVTGVTAVTAQFRQGPAQSFDAVSRLRAMSITDAFWGQRWVTMILDAEAFLSSWGDQAKQLGWTELNLFGVHPKVPASRFDVMGLIPLLDGGRVIALTDATATIRKPSGSIQRYARKSDHGCAVPIWEIAN